MTPGVTFRPSGRAPEWASLRLPSGGVNVNLRKTVYAVFGLWMFVVLALVIVLVFTDASTDPGQFGNYAMFSVLLVAVVGWAAYFWDVFHNPRVPVDKRALWAVVLAFVGPYAMPFYFWFYIRGNDSPPLAPPLSGPPPLPSMLANDPLARVLLPVGRSGWAIAARYLGLLSLLVAPAPLAIAAGLLALADMRRHPEKLGMGRAVIGLVMGALGTVALVILLGFRGHVWSEPDWGNKRIVDALAQIRPSDVRVATVDLDRCPRQPVSLRSETVPALLAHLRFLQSAQTIGERGQWEQWRLLVLDCGPKGRFKIVVGTRPSLGNRAIVSVEQGTETTELGFYEGAAFWSWLQTIPESTTLGGGPRPCK
jgi:hypothetical protein